MTRPPFHSTDSWLVTEFQALAGQGKWKECWKQTKKELKSAGKCLKWKETWALFVYNNKKSRKVMESSQKCLVYEVLSSLDDYILFWVQQFIQQFNAGCSFKECIVYLYTLVIHLVSPYYPHISWYLCPTGRLTSCLPWLVTLVSEVTIYPFISPGSFFPPKIWTKYYNFSSGYSFRSVACHLTKYLFITDGVSVDP